MVELLRLWKLDCTSEHSSACALTLKKFRTQTEYSFEVLTPIRNVQCVLCSLPWMSVR
jgi:hypothetical protein